METVESISLYYKPTWVVAAVCFVIILISLFAERGLNYLGKCLTHSNQGALFEALQKLKAGLISQICIPSHFESTMLPCKKHTEIKGHENYSPPAINNEHHLLSEKSGSFSDHCSLQGKVPLLSTESFHELHILIFVVAVVHVVSCAVILVLGGARIRQWKPWEDSISKVAAGPAKVTHRNHLNNVLKKLARGYWRRAAVISWIISFFKQFYSSVTMSEYIALREGFIMTNCLSHQEFDFHKDMVESLERDFRHVVGISWYQWLFVVVFLALNVDGKLLLLVGAKLEHIIVRLAQDVDVMKKHPGQESAWVRPSDEYFWFNRPRLLLDFIHFILFQNAFEIAFFFWILWTYGFSSCMMEKKGYIITRLIIGVIVQVLCSYITLPLYALVTKMGTASMEESVSVSVSVSVPMQSPGII
ncbi:MLO-like protein 13 isoform X1 [Gossypium australe]|uniref:MLO-like protein n=1 Tax=Gossypium australe TaxID=47621 RepID=A0A5B6VNK5_9ROSI|nr:MLO-like protein 13 isoform X1 [Gossypium australe]